ncbi:RHS repeat domain-containing protein [Candidatus Uabimicrobium sp. HlEnr_7]|uniref:RHS repeat domain-containing protein n=1 Tax=Candidatus Uabimicrobium helgolandensis TaxID=3095367 RepID=UPI003557A5F4
MRYDENENLVEVKSPLAVSGADANNITRTLYDERDLVIATISSPGAAIESKSTTEIDANGNVLQVADAEDTDGDGEREKTLFKYDRFDRLVETTTSTGEVVQQKYDPASNVIESSIFGTVSGLSRTANSTTGNTLLSRTHAFYDELSRVFKQEAELFVSTGITTVRPVVLNGTDGSLTRMSFFCIQSKKFIR